MKLLLAFVFGIVLTLTISATLPPNPGPEVVVTKLLEDRLVIRHIKSMSDKGFRVTSVTAYTDEQYKNVPDRQSAPSSFIVVMEKRY